MAEAPINRSARSREGDLMEPQLPPESRSKIVDYTDDESDDSDDSDDDDDDSLTMEERLTLLEEARWEIEQEAEIWKEQAERLAVQLQQADTTAAEALSTSHALESEVQRTCTILNQANKSNGSLMQQEHVPAKRRGSLSERSESTQSSSERMPSARSLTESIRASNDRIESMVHQLEGTDHEVPHLKEENEIILQNQKELEKELEGKNVVLIRLKNLLENSRSRESDLQAEIKDLEQITGEMGKQISLLEDENEELKERQGDELMLRMKMLLEKTRARESVANKKSKELQREVDTMKGIIATLEDGNRQLLLEKDMEDAKEKEILDENEMNKLGHENIRLLAKQKEMEGALQAEKETVRRLEAKLQIATTKFEAASTQMTKDLPLKGANKRDRSLREERAAKEQRLRDRLKVLAGMSHVAFAVT
jgi:chromosome segregation ATPase